MTSKDCIWKLFQLAGNTERLFHNAYYDKDISDDIADDIAFFKKFTVKDVEEYCEIDISSYNKYIDRLIKILKNKNTDWKQEVILTIVDYEDSICELLSKNLQ